MSLIFAVCSAEASNFCDIQEAGFEKKVRINGIPGFFFKVHPDGEYLTYIDQGHNSLLDLNTGVSYKAPGNIDPVWSPDGKFVTHPGVRGEKDEAIEGIVFYEGDEFLKQVKAGKSEELKPTHSNLAGVYQSIGVQDGKYKVITDRDGISVADFEYTKKGIKQTSEVSSPCSNIQGMGTDLPMISKDGRFISAYDLMTSSTRIYKLNGNDCSLALDLGYGTGKVAFNSDSSQIAFHIDQFSDFDSGYFSGVGKDKVKNVVVLNLEETKDGKLNPTSWALASKNIKPGNGGYYPDFDKHGNIYYIEDIDNDFQFVKVSQKNLEMRPVEEDLEFAKKHCVNCESKETPSFIVRLANIWKAACEKRDEVPAEFVMGIDPIACREMVNEFYLPEMNIKKEELLKACPQLPNAKGEIVGEWDPNQKKDAEAILKGKCLACHAHPVTYEGKEFLIISTGPDDWTEEEVTIKKVFPPLDLDNLDHSTASAMAESIISGQMPKNDPLEDNQRKDLYIFLQKRLLDLEETYESSYNSIRRYSEENIKLEKSKAYQQYPELGKEYIDNMIDCYYGQKCEGHIKHSRVLHEQEASDLPESERAKFLYDKEMEIRCSNLYEVTAQQCYDWRRLR